jgi:hypothetical protein
MDCHNFIDTIKLSLLEDVKSNLIWQVGIEIMKNIPIKTMGTKFRSKFLLLFVFVKVGKKL